MPKVTSKPKRPPVNKPEQQALFVQIFAYEDRGLHFRRRGQSALEAVHKAHQLFMHDQKIGPLDFRAIFERGIREGWPTGEEVPFWQRLNQTKP